MVTEAPPEGVAILPGLVSAEVNTLTGECVDPAGLPLVSALQSDRSAS